MLTALFVVGLLFLVAGFAGVSWAFHSIETLGNDSMENAVLGLFGVIGGVIGIIMLIVWGIIYLWPK